MQNIILHGLWLSTCVNVPTVVRSRRQIKSLGDAGESEFVNGSCRLLSLGFVQGSLTLEGASMCLLSKCIPASLRGGKSILNAGKTMLMCSHIHKSMRSALCTL